MNKSAWLVSALMFAASSHAHEPQDNETNLGNVVVLGSAQEVLKQAPGVSIITADDLSRNPVSNDLAEAIRTMPGVNLTGNSTSGQRGNNRQIDIRGMGPENTMILIDGKPVGSRNSVRYGWRGERDTRGDTGWVPMEAVERIEVLRGPAAARYGSGSAGGVVNIITKGVPDKASGQVSVYTNHPQSSDDGASQRINILLSGPLSDRLGYRLSGNIAKTDSDAWDINRGHQSTRGIAGNGTDYSGTFPAGREGVRNKDVAGRLTFEPVSGHKLALDGSFSRQGNIYTGDTQNTNNYTKNAQGELVPTSARVQQHIGAETNIIYRDSYTLTHNGEYDFGRSLSYVQYEKTRNSRLDEGLAGGTEGLFSADSMSTSMLEHYQAHSKLDIPLHLAGLEQVFTIGTEWLKNTLNDANSMSQTTTEGGHIPGLATNRTNVSKDNIVSVFIEDNIELRDGLTFTPGLRYDHHDITGSNWSPALNITQQFLSGWALKAGIARAYKAPNLYQTNPNYLLYSRGIGCWGAGGACYLQGNPNLKAETSTNKELGIEFIGDDLVAGVTWFHNSYHNKVEASTKVAGNTVGGTGNFANADIFLWDNIPKAVIEGVEGTLNIRLASAVQWSNNLTWMLQSKNKVNGEALSVIPQFTLNSRLEWEATDVLNLFTHITWYGKQVPNKYDYQGKLLVGEEQSSLSPYALVNLGGRYLIDKKISLAAGVNNVLDKRLYRKGNAVGVGDPRTIYGAGAATYNEPGRSIYLAATYKF